MMKRRVRRTLLALVPLLGVLGIGFTASSAEAVKGSNPTITGLSATPGTLYNNGGIVTLSATVSNATTCTFTSTKAVTGLTSGPCSPRSVGDRVPLRDTVVLPPNTTKNVVPYKFGLIVTGTKTVKTRRVTVTVGIGPPPPGGPFLSGVVSTVSTGGGSCALLTTNQVDCWGYNEDGELGRGTVIDYSDIPTRVVGVGGIGTLSDVTSLATIGSGFCALLMTSRVDCWGGNWYGQLGNGATADSFAPTQVLGVGGIGTLSDVTSLTAGIEGYCALLTTDQVDCWGYNEDGELGNGTTSDSATPTQVVGVGGTGSLSGVASLTSGGSDTPYDDANGFCALLTTNQVDCWGLNREGELGNRTTANSDTPTQVVGVGGTGALSGVTSLVIGGSSTGGFCALLATSQVDCWGANTDGQLGNGSTTDSVTPTQVVGVGGTGALSGVTSVTVDDIGGYCALLTTSQVDCWGYDVDGELGNGAMTDSDTPTPVVGIARTGVLSGVTSLTSDGSGYCALLTTSQVDCWGGNDVGELGNLTATNDFFPPYGSDVPTQVVGVGGTGALNGVNSLTGGGGFYCALLATSQLDCWGINWYGELGNPILTESDAPIQVFAPS